MQSVRFKIAVAISLAAVSATDIASDWPQFRGPHRDGTWDETAVLEKFPAEGIKIEWKHPAGGGWSSPVADGKVFVFDAEMIKPKSRERLHCFDQKTGKVLWQFTYEEPYGDWAYVPERGAGPTATPIIDSLLSEKKAREMIIVMPFGHAVEFGGPEQSQNNEKMENYVLKDLAPLI